MTDIFATLYFDLLNNKNRMARVTSGCMRCPSYVPLSHVTIGTHHIFHRHNFKNTTIQSYNSQQLSYTVSAGVLR